METGWPGDPQSLWERVKDDPGLWVPGPDALPAWDSPNDLHRKYLIVPAWWQRAIHLFLVLIVAGALYAVGPGLDWESYGLVRRVLAVVLLTVLVGAALFLVVSYVRNEVLWRANRTRVLAAASEKLSGDRIPIWGVLVGKVRLGDRVSGPNDTPDDIQFMFDLRVPPGVLRRQRAVAAAWADAVAAAQTTNVPKELGAAFDGRFSVHCAHVFGEGMRGVWMWRKGSVLPYEVLGLATTDPRDAEEFTDDDVVFIRKTPPELRRLSQIAKR